MDKEDSIRTYLDDIKFQIVRENNKRTPFYNSDFQIVAKNKQVIREIEKKEKLVSTEFRRQQVALEGKLQKLQMAKKELGLTEDHPRAQNINRRRYSVPSTSTLFMTAQETPVSRGQNSANSRDQVFESLRKSDNLKKVGETVWCKDIPSDNYKDTRNRKDSRPSNPDDKELQRISCISPAEGSDDVHKRFHSNAFGTRRRATIAEGSTFDNVLPSECLLNKLSYIKVKATSNGEET